jgi:hypothetical protein
MAEIRKSSIHDDNPIVEINQFSFGKPVNVDPDDYSRSHKNPGAVNIQDTFYKGRIVGNCSTCVAKTKGRRM